MKWIVKYVILEAVVLFKISALKDFANFTGKHLCWSLFLIITKLLQSLEKHLQSNNGPPVLTIELSGNTNIETWNMKHVNFLLGYVQRGVLWA